MPKQTAALGKEKRNDDPENEKHTPLGILPSGGALLPTTGKFSRGGRIIEQW